MAGWLRLQAVSLCEALLAAAGRLGRAGRTAVPQQQQCAGSSSTRQAADLSVAVPVNSETCAELLASLAGATRDE